MSMKTLWLSSLLSGLLLSSAQPALACVEPTTQQVIVWHAGSLSNAFGALYKTFTCDTGIQVVDKAGGSVDLVRQITAGGQPADVLASADYLNIELFLKPEGYADYDIRFLESKMVLAYLKSALAAKDGGAGYTIDDGTAFNPPEAIPNAAADWYTYLLKPDVTAGGSSPFLDPGGYRTAMIYRLAQSYYQVPNLYDSLLTHHVITAAISKEIAIGSGYDIQFLYEGSAYAAWKTNPEDYRYVNLPDAVNLGSPALNDFYRQAEIVMPDLSGEDHVTVPASRVTYGLTVVKNAPNSANGVAFVKYLLGPIGQAALASYQLRGLSPAQVSRDDYRVLPSELKPFVSAIADDRGVGRRGHGHGHK